MRLLLVLFMSLTLTIIANSNVMASNTIPANPQSCSVEQLQKLPVELQYCEMAVVMAQSDFETVMNGSPEFGTVLSAGTIAPGKIIFSAVLSLAQIIQANSDARVLAILPNLRCKNGKCTTGTGSFTVKNSSISNDAEIALDQIEELELNVEY